MKKDLQERSHIVFNNRRDDDNFLPKNMEKKIVIFCVLFVISQIYAADSDDPYVGNEEYNPRAYSAHIAYCQKFFESPITIDQKLLKKRNSACKKNKIQQSAHRQKKPNKRSKRS